MSNRSQWLRKGHLRAIYGLPPSDEPDLHERSAKHAHGFDGNDNFGRLTARARVDLVVTQGVGIESQRVSAGRSEVNIPGVFTVGKLGTATASISNEKLAADGTLSFTVTIKAENGFKGYRGAPGTPLI